MIINTRGVEINPPKDYIKKEGSYILKIESVIEDGFTTDGHAKIKMSFIGAEVGTKEPILNHTEMFNVGEKSLWRIKQLEVALKAPECYDINDFVGRYVIGHVVAKKYTKQNGEVIDTFNIKSWDYSVHNDKLPPIKEAVINQNEPTIEEIADDGEELLF